MVFLKDQYLVHCVLVFFIKDMPLAVDGVTVLFADDAAFVITATTLEGVSENR